MNSTDLPTDWQIEELHHKYAKTDKDFELIYNHCKVVEAIAMQLLDSKSVQIDRRLVHIGCLLHDIGVYPLMDDGGHIKRGVTHGVEGEAILKNEGFSEVIWRFASHHTGVGLTKQDVINQGLPIPVGDYTANTDEERLIMYADKFHTKNNPPTEPPYFCTFEWYRDSVKKFGEDKTENFDRLAELFGRPDLKPLSERFGYGIWDIN